jgi:hypothetical protein
MVTIFDACRARASKHRPLAGLGAAFSALFLFATAAPAVADRLEHRGTQEEQAACTPDVFRLCASFIPSAKSPG